MTELNDLQAENERLDEMLEEAHGKIRVLEAEIEKLKAQPTPADLLAAKPLVEALSRSQHETEKIVVFETGRQFYDCQGYLCNQIKILDQLTLISNRQKQALTQTKTLAQHSAAVWEFLADAYQAVVLNEGYCGWSIPGCMKCVDCTAYLKAKALPPEIIEMAKRAGGNDGKPK